MKISLDEKYEIGQYIFFKLKGYPWWPGQIINIESHSKKDTYLCGDSSTNTISKISDKKCIAKFEDNIEYVIRNIKNKKYIDSIIVGIENVFEGKKMPKKYEKIIKDLNYIKEGKKISDKNKENTNNDNSNSNDELLNKKRK